MRLTVASSSTDRLPSSLQLSLAWSLAPRRGKALEGGHWLPEERPNDVYAELKKFLVA